MKIQILYLMHTDINWAKQRPHFVAEILGQHFPITVFYRPNPKLMFKRNTLGIIKRPIPFLPLPNLKASIFGSINSLAQRIWLRFWLKNVFGSDDHIVIWVTHPLMLECLPQPVPRNVSLVYDCMDDVGEFAVSAAVRNRIEKAETYIARHASKIFFSSHWLRQQFEEKFERRVGNILMRNGVSDKVIAATVSPAAKLKETNLCYFGTISEWFNFDFILAALDHFPMLVVSLIGPADIAIPKHPRLRVLGLMPHDRLIVFAKRFDAFVMPFKVTKLIEGVDPVKLYEYIAMGRPTISVYYDEIEQFRPHVHFYRDVNEFLRLISRLEKGKLAAPSAEATAVFLRDSSWTARVTIAVSEIKGLESLNAPQANDQKIA